VEEGAAAFIKEARSDFYLRTGTGFFSFQKKRAFKKLRSSMLFLKKKVCFEKKLCPSSFLQRKGAAETLKFFFVPVFTLILLFQKKPSKSFFLPEHHPKRKMFGPLKYFFKKPSLQLLFFLFYKERGKGFLLEHRPKRLKVWAGALEFEFEFEF